MNVYTNKNSFIMTAQDILNTSDLFIKEECMIVDDVLYERLDDSFEHKYRFFFSDDDYDYLENQEMIDRLDKLFEERDNK